MRKTYGDTRLFHNTLRIGKGGKPFALTKIRTMGIGAHEEYAAVIGSATLIRPLKDDMRITKFGRFLRITHIDEIPQIINVLKGQMAPVGLRPLHKSQYNSLPADIKGMYNEIGPGLLGIAYACKRFPPSNNELFGEYKNFYKIWKKNRARAYVTYALRILANRVKGVSWSG